MIPLIIVLFCFVTNIVQITLKDNGYEGIVLTISDKIPENPELLDKIKEWLAEASEKLYIATKKQLYLREITIRVPSQWPNQGHYSLVGESSVNVHIKVAEENPRIGPNPYTHGITGCGHQAQFIHFTPEFILKGNSTGDYGNIGVTFVHEWGHFRWGLLDESPSVEDNDGNKFEFYLHRGTWDPVRCTKYVEGDIVNKRTNKECHNVNKQTGKPGVDCIFKPYSDSRATAKASIMGHSFVPTVSFFCENNPNNPKINHNRFAYNLQNIRCDEKSSWEVMKQHDDFKNINEMEIQDRAPKFNLVQTVADRICLVIDVSGSMKDLIERTHNAIALLIKYVIPNTAYVGIVKFSTDATLLKGMTKILSEADRDSLVSSIPTTTSGSTSIGAGLNKALEALSKLETLRGSVIYLATDGKENSSPRIAGVLPKLLAHRVIVHTLAITGNADSKIANISRATGGSNYFYSESALNSTVLIDALSEPFANSQTDPIIRILSLPVPLRQNEVFKTTFVIDDSIGRETVIQFTASDVKGVNLTVTSEGDAYTTIGTSADPGVIAVKLPGKAKVGNYTVALISTQSVSGTLLGQSKSAEAGNDTIKIKSWTRKSNMNYAVNVQFPIFVSVERGNVPVSNAEVTVFIENENGKTSTLILKDNAIGADIIANDGIYSGFVLSNLISSGGRHSFKIIVKGDNSSIVAPKSRAPRIGDENTHHSDDQIGPFMRVTLANEVFVSNYIPTDSTVDKIPPSPIKTLGLSKVNNDNNKFTVTWRAVGDDFDTGRAFSYDLRKSNNFSQLVDNPDEQEKILIGLTPSEAGNIETFSFTLESIQDKETYFIAIRAIDESNNKGTISNIISVSILSKESPWIEEPEATSVPISPTTENSEDTSVPISPTENSEDTSVTENPENTSLPISMDENLENTSVPISVNKNHEDTSLSVSVDQNHDDIQNIFLYGMIPLVVVTLAIIVFVFCRKRKTNSYSVSFAVILL